MDDPNAIIFDVRNHYESEVSGSFRVVHTAIASLPYRLVLQW